MVDTDDLIDIMAQTAKELSEELGQNWKNYSEEEKQKLYKIIGLGL